ncbi:MAG: T9SS type A sorting domain-containing protein, partial [Bacteroidota bacterium]
LLGQELTFSLEGGATLTDPNGRVSNITAVDIEAQNGVVHVIDEVVLPDLTATGIENYSKINMQFYPNPATDYITISSDEMNGKLQIIDISGKILKVINVTQPAQRVELSGIQPGIYFISLESGNTKVTEKLIVR